MLGNEGADSRAGEGGIETALVGVERTGEIRRVVFAFGRDIVLMEVFVGNVKLDSFVGEIETASNAQPEGFEVVAFQNLRRTC